MFLTEWNNAALCWLAIMAAIIMFVMQWLWHENMVEILTVGLMFQSLC